MPGKVYSISYDLRQPGRNYQNLYDAIKGLDGSCQHPIESNWFIKSDLNEQSVYDSLRPYIDDNDMLFVVEISDSDRQGWMPRSFWDWIKN